MPFFSPRNFFYETVFPFRGIISAQNLASLFVCPPLSRHLRSCIFHSDINHTALDRGKAERERALNSFSLSLSLIPRPPFPLHLSMAKDLRMAKVTKHSEAAVFPLFPFHLALCSLPFSDQTESPRFPTFSARELL